MDDGDTVKPPSAVTPILKSEIPRKTYGGRGALAHLPDSLRGAESDTYLSDWERLARHGLGTLGEGLVSSLLVREMAAERPRTSFEEAIGFGSILQKQSQLNAILKAWAENDPEGLRTYFIDSPRTRQFEILANLAALNLATDHPEKAFEILSHGWSFSNPTIREVFRSWGRADGAGALRAIEMFPENPSETRGLMIRSAAAGRIEGSGRDGIEWAMAFPSSVDREIAISGAVEALAEQDVDDAIRVLSGISEESLRKRLVVNLSGSVAAKDSVKAYELIESELSGRQKSIAIYEIFRSGIRKESIHFFENALSEMPIGLYTDQAKEAFAHAVARVDPGKALEYARVHSMGESVIEQISAQSIRFNRMSMSGIRFVEDN